MTTQKTSSWGSKVEVSPIFKQVLPKLGPDMNGGTHHQCARLVEEWSAKCPFGTLKWVYEIH